MLPQWVAGNESQPDQGQQNNQGKSAKPVKEARQAKQNGAVICCCATSAPKGAQTLPPWNPAFKGVPPLTSLPKGVPPCGILPKGKAPLATPLEGATGPLKLPQPTYCRLDWHQRLAHAGPALLERCPPIIPPPSWLSRPAAHANGLASPLTRPRHLEGYTSADFPAILL